MENFFSVARKYLEIDGNVSRSDILEKLKSNKSAISKIFYYLSEEEKKEYFCYAYSHTMISYLRNFNIDDKIDILVDVYNNIENYDLYRIFIDTDDDMEKEKYLAVFFEYLPEYYISLLIETVSDEGLKIKMCDKYLSDNSYLFRIVLTLSDLNKEKYIDRFSSINDQIEIILSFKDCNLIKKYVYMDKYKEYRAELVAGSNNYELIVNEFNGNAYNIIFRIKLINMIEDENIKLRLVHSLNDDCVRMFYLSNINNCKNLLSELTGTVIDKDITFGVELECSNEYIDKFMEIENIFGDYKIKKDSSVKNGFEIVSGILKYDTNDLNKLKNVCDLLYRCNFYTDYSAGSHIHIGAKYLDRKEDYIMLLYLYLNCEDILYFISDRKNTIKRRGIKSYASKNKIEYIKAIDAGLFTLEYNNIKELFDKICSSRYRGLNLKNIDKIDKNTIEFRMPNGEINFDELLLNIKLFGRLVEISHKLNDMEDDNYVKKMAFMIGNTKSEKERLELLLNLLFDYEEERKIYRDRYFSNKILYLKNMNNLIKEIKDSFHDRELVCISNGNRLVKSKKK